MKGIILAGGHGTRLYPSTMVQSKQLLPIYDKPMIYYPLSLLMRCGIKEVLLISTTQDLPGFQKLFKDGSHLGIHIEYKNQDRPDGLAQAFIIGEEFIDNDNVTLILGDNLFHGEFEIFRQTMDKQIKGTDGIKARIFGHVVSDPERYGVVEFDDKSHKVVSIEEKPKKPRSNYAIPGLYVFDNTVSKRAKEQRPSPRGELEITDLIQSYLNESVLGVEIITRAMTWLDTGTPQSLLEASNFIAAIEQRSGQKIACIEEVAWRSKMICDKQLGTIIDCMPKSEYKQYLVNLLSNN